MMSLRIRLLVFIAICLALNGCASVPHHSTLTATNCGASEIVLTNLAKSNSKRVFLLPDRSQCITTEN